MSRCLKFGKDGSMVMLLQLVLTTSDHTPPSAEELRENEIPEGYELPYGHSLVKDIEWKVPRVGDEWSTGKFGIMSKVLRVLHIPEAEFIEVHLDAESVLCLMGEAHTRETAKPGEDYPTSWPGFRLTTDPTSAVLRE